MDTINVQDLDDAYYDSDFDDVEVSKRSQIECSKDSDELEKPPICPSGKQSEAKKWSKCCDHFVQYKTPNERKRAKCKHCGTSYACDPNINGTRNLNAHIRERCKVLAIKRTENDPKQKALVQTRQKTLDGLQVLCLPTHLVRRIVRRLWQR